MFAVNVSLPTVPTKPAPVSIPAVSVSVVPATVVLVSAIVVVTVEEAESTTSVAGEVVPVTAPKVTISVSEPSVKKSDVTGTVIVPVVAPKANATTPDCTV